jgi:hypothetical protein
MIFFLADLCLDLYPRFSLPLCDDESFCLFVVMEDRTFFAIKYCLVRVEFLYSLEYGDSMILTEKVT